MGDQWPEGPGALLGAVEEDDGANDETFGDAGLDVGAWHA
jgi:hypothetical protein